MKKQTGFTLIELIVVIVILGILAATALPRFVNLQDDAGRAAANGVAGALASASAINFGARQLSAGRALNPNTITNTGCDATLLNMLTAVPAGYAIAGPAACVAGNNLVCTVTNNNVNPAVVVNAGITCY